MSRRTQQVADELRAIVGSIIQREVKDPRVGFATVVGVQVSDDLQHARVAISVMGSAADRQATMAALARAAGFIRRCVARELRHLRVVPELQFMHDTSLDYSVRINEVLRDVAAERAANPPNLPDDAP